MGMEKLKIMKKIKKMVKILVLQNFFLQTFNLWHNNINLLNYNKSNNNNSNLINKQFKNNHNKISINKVNNLIEVK